MRTIDADALIDVLKREEKEDDEYGLTQRADGITDAIMAVMDAPTIEPQRWIPVTEAMPEEKQDVLLAFKHNMVVGFWEDILNDGGQAWYANSGNGWMTGTETVDDDGYPLAWMPLPEPWRGGQGDSISD